MQNKLYLLGAVLFLAACGHTNPPVEPGVRIEQVIVKVPVAIPCNAIPPLAPQFNFEKLVITDSIYDKTKALLADRKLHLAYEAELLAALNSCLK